jgi:predicted molibdopterin-dependent oxidoreductase YjgC
MPAADLRIGKGVTRGAPARFRFDGAEIAAVAGESVAAALLAAGIRTLGRAPGDGGPRGMFCAMGSCQECVVLIGGRLVEACRVPVHDGLVVASRPLPPDLPA